MSAARWLLLSLALSSFGCAWAKASPADYAAYRKTRTGATFEERIGAAHDYLREYPEGAYAPEVRKYFEAAEPVFFDSREKSFAGLQSYIAVLPEGPHASQVHSRLAAIAEQRARPDALAVAAANTEERLKAAAKARERAEAELTFWATSLSDPEAYKAPMSEGPAELVVAFSLSLPAPVCKSEGEGRACEKKVVMPYVVPARGSFAERELAFTVYVQMDATGRPLSSTIAGPELLLRLHEIKELRAIDAPADNDRTASIAAAIELLTGAFESKVKPDPSCRKETTVPEILRRECGAMRLVATVGDGPGSTDVILVEPTGG